ncbi:MAG TPA: NlpC/P60 family protein [Mycobacteriales bacterium]|nr:NlpC/P60 family protein [Mycobacteriales bacterium]
MATSGLTTRMLRTATVAAVASLAVGLAPGAGNAAPPQTVSGAQQQILALNGKLEPIVEKYNAAQIELGRKKKAQSAATHQARALDVRMQSLSGKVRQMASAAYRSVPFGEFTSIMTSRSPQDFLDQLSALDTIASRRDAAIQSLSQAKAKADKAEQNARKAASDAQALFNQIRAQKASIEKQVTQAQSLLSQLTADERASLFAGRASRSTTRVDISNLPAPPNAEARTAVNAALGKQGSPYVWAAAGPDTFDCSGLTMWAWAQAGVSLPHQSQSQYATGTHVSRANLLPGDLVFFYSPIHHVGLYIGDNLMVQAPQTGDVVKISSMDDFPYTGATRVW